MNPREKKTVIWGGIALAIYLVFFFGFRASKSSQASNSEYDRFVKNPLALQKEFQTLQTKQLLLEKLNETFKIDPSKFSKATVVADASAAIQNAATSGGIQLGPIRESSARTSAREITSMQLEGAGQVPAIMKFLHQVNTLGFPLLVDSLQVNPDNTRPGNIKINLTIVVLDYEQWKRT